MSFHWNFHSFTSHKESWQDKTDRKNRNVSVIEIYLQLHKKLIYLFLSYKPTVSKYNISSIRKGVCIKKRTQANFFVTGPESTEVKVRTKWLMLNALNRTTSGYRKAAHWNHSCRLETERTTAQWPCGSISVCEFVLIYTCGERQNSCTVH